MKSNRPRRPSNQIQTRSGRNLKVNRSMGERFMAMREGKALRKVQRLRGLPKSRIKRLAWRLNPKRQAEYWFSRDGAIMALKIGGIGILLMFIFTLGVFAFFRKDLPKIKDISGGNLGGSISYYDRTGKTLLWQDYNSVKRVPVASADISPFMKEATVAVEDRDFYNHRGFDIKGIGRAAYNDIIKHGSTQGGSTITQQLVKLTQDWTQQRSIARKVKELILAVELERTYTKDDILTGYLNNAPYAGVDYGVQSAAGDYFHKSAKDLTLAEAAMLAAIPKAPSVYSPYSGEYFNKPAFIARQHYVLDVMVQTHKITKAQADEAKKVDVLAEVQPQQTKYAGIKAPYFVLAAKKELEKKFSCTNTSGCNKIGGWRVITTLDMDMQTTAEQKIAANIPNALRGGADSQAIVAEDVPTGQMVALVGGTDFTNKTYGEINYAQTAIPPGSSFKPYDYVSLINFTNNSGAGSVLYDVQQPLPGYLCTDKTTPSKTNTHANCLWDYDFKYPGPLSLRYALGGSRNVPAVKAMLTVGTDKVISTANDLMAAPGAYNCYANAELTEKTQCYGASAIGDGAFLHLDQHVNGLASLARMGQAIPTTYILNIQDGAGKSKPFYEWKQPKAKQVVKPEAAYIVDDMASDPNASYLPSGFYKFQSYKGWRIAVKTGTTNDNFDGLMTAWTTKYAVASWVGHHSRQVALHAGGMEYLTTPLTRGLITAALDKAGTPVNWTAPSGIKKLPAFVVRNHVGVGSIEPSPSVDIFPSWYQAKTGSSQSQTLDKVSNKLATTCTPTLAKQTVGGGNVSALSSDTFYGSGSSSTTQQSGSDDVHSCSDSPPSVASVFVSGQDVTGGGTANCTANCTITTTINAGTHPLSDPQYAQFPGTVNLLINGSVAQSKTVSDSPSTVSFTYSGTGTATVAIQVIDSVLYDDTSSTATILFSSSPGPGNGGGNGGGEQINTTTNFCTLHPNNKRCQPTQQEGLNTPASRLQLAALFFFQKRV